MGVQIRPMWTLVSEGYEYKNFPKMDLRVSKLLSNKIICLPSGVKKKSEKNFIIRKTVDMQNHV